jgi:ATP-dependent helicase/nuclease subunit B
LAVKLLVGPPASGKTETCVQRIQAVRKDHPLEKVWVIVPDRQKAPFFQRRLSRSGGGIGIKIGTFRDLYCEILERNGIYKPVVSPALENRLLQEDISAALEHGELDHYEIIAHKPGFFLVLQDAFAELRGAYVKPETFLELTKGSTDARHELAILYNRYLKQLEQLNYIDTEGQSWLAIDALVDNPQAGRDIALLVVDGFTSFSGVRRAFLKELSGRVEEVIITLPGEKGFSRQVNRRSKKEFEQLKNAFEFEEEYLGNSLRLAKNILHIEKNIFETSFIEKLATPHPLLFEVRSQTEEARESLRWIKGLNVREGIPLSDCAIITSNLEVYQPLLRAAADEFGIRVHFSHPQSLLDSPLIKSLLALFGIPGNDYNTRSLLNILHSPYFDFGLDDEMIQDLEKVSQQAIIVKGREQWDNAWKMFDGLDLNDLDYLDEDRHIENLLKGVDLKALRMSFEKFWDFFDEIDVIQSLKKWVAWLEQRFEDLRFVENLSSDWDWEAYQVLGDTLKAIVISEEITKDREVSYNQFLKDLEITLNGAQIKEPKELRHNSILVAGVIEARAFRFKAIALLGFSEGLFPVVENPDPFLDEEMRRDLKMETRLGRDQSSIFYQAITRTEEHLLLTRPYLSEGGEKREPSPYWLSVKTLFTDAALMKIQPTTQRPQAYASSSEELLFWAIQQNHIFYNLKELDMRWHRINHGAKILKARRSKHPCGVYEGHVDQLIDLLVSQYSSEQIWSPSRLENYATCPYDFYVQSILNLNERQIPEVGLNAAQRGNIYHQILEKTYSQAGINLDRDALLSLLEDCAESVYLTAPKEFGFRESPLWEVEKKQYTDTLRETVIKLEEQKKDWIPIQLEANFGRKGNQPLSLELGAGKILIRGTIDRVDRNSRGEIRVIDYKSGGSHLANADLNSGRRLQISIYALAAQKALNFGNVVDGFYWNINGAESSSIRLSRTKHEDLKGPQAAYAILYSHLERIVNGIREGKFPPSVPKGGCPKYCPAASWCWRYKPTPKFGGR